MAKDERSAEILGPSPERIRQVDLILRLGQEANKGHGGWGSDGEPGSDDVPGPQLQATKPHSFAKRLVRAG